MFMLPRTWGPAGSTPIGTVEDLLAFGRVHLDGGSAPTGTRVLPMRLMNDGRAGGRHLLTIGRLAAYAGVTTKAVRVYHERGLLPEPPRDSSGYRRYSADHAVQLVKIRTLVETGVPLARIGELLEADPEQFAAAVDEIDRTLRRRAEQIRRTRHRLAQLADGDRLFVSEQVADYLEQLRRIGVGERTVRLERDLWILLQSVAPDQAAAWVADKLAAITDPEFRALYLDRPLPRLRRRLRLGARRPRLPAIAELASRLPKP